MSRWNRRNKTKQYGLVLVNKYGARHKAVTATVDPEDRQAMRRHLIDLAVQLENRRRNRADDWASEYALEVRPAGGGSFVIARFKES